MLGFVAKALSAQRSITTMLPIKRRHFLQATGSTLAAIALTQVDFRQQATQFDRVVAQSAPRKFALLVGINDYQNGISPLNGCLMDVKLQRMLLEHRYGFAPGDIVALTDAQATRKTILETFERHLIAQAQPGDIVVFHYSGHGWMVLDPDPNPHFFQEEDGQNKGVNGTLIPYDWDQGEQGNIRCISGHTLFLLMSALKTELVTVVLDSCHAGGGLRGNVRVRSLTGRRGVIPAQIPPLPKEEQTDQQTWLAKLALSESEFKQRRKQGVAKGVGIGSASLQQDAIDAQFDGFNAGAFTYLLTRYLWQLPIPQTLAAAFTSLTLGTQMQAGNGNQVPQYEVKAGSTDGNQPILFLSPPYLAAEAVIHEVPQPGQPIKFWLGGVSPQTLAAYQPNAVFELIDAQGKAVGEIEQTTERVGLEAAGKLKSGRGSPTQGMLLRQKIGGIPTGLTLKLGLDPSLGDLLSPVHTALAAVTWLEVVPLGQGRSVNYILGRMTAENRQRLSHLRGLPEERAIVLFNADLTPVPEAFGIANETIESAINRLRPRLKSLLARRILQAILGDASGLKVSAEIMPAF